MYPTELRQLLQSAFAVEPRGHITRDGVIARLKKRGDVYQAMALHHGLPVSSNMLLKKITDCIRHMHVCTTVDKIILQLYFRVRFRVGIVF